MWTFVRYFCLSVAQTGAASHGSPKSTTNRIKEHRYTHAPESVVRPLDETENDRRTGRCLTDEDLDLVQGLKQLRRWRLVCDEDVDLFEIQRLDDALSFELRRIRQRNHA